MGKVHSDVRLDNRRRTVKMGKSTSDVRLDNRRRTVKMGLYPEISCSGDQCVFDATCVSSTCVCYTGFNASPANSPTAGITWWC
ncbi:Hypothetical predicted protein [Mytilus galloprovincialis]|uniref:EB domain-containing protein n=1 Tax=Mytilus galloprovincialis TaxID=29158 RepID=A0A8B6DBT5_MYTGA|nr:Hypothetical predicted protein [Mytilus galloprovincialis]